MDDLHQRLLFRARIVLPIARPPISDGGLLISGNRIVAVGHWRDLASEQAHYTADLGEVVLLPGLVNAHCHLDYTNMAGQFPPPKLFTDWIKLITTTKAEWGYSEFAESWLNGARMLLRNGTTTVGDIEACPELLPQVWDTTPLSILSFLEMTGVRSRRQPKAIVRETVARIDSLPVGRCRAGLSPHAPYSTLPELLRLSAETSRSRDWPLAIHVAESAQEFEMFSRGQGEMFDWLRRNQRDMSDCGLGSPIQHLERCGALGPNVLAIHVNYLASDDVGLLSQHSVNVVHCPRSHAFFSHDPFSFTALSKAGINISLATDSLASVYKNRRQSVELNLFEEMRAFASQHPSVHPRDVLKMVTVNPSQALGLKRKAGELSKDSFADFITVPFAGKITQAFPAIVNHRGPVSSSMINGQWALAPGPA